MEQERIAKLETKVEVIKENVTEVRTNIKELHSRISTGNREIVEKMEAMQIAIQSSANEQIKALQSSTNVQIKEIDSRVRSLERWKWIIVGAAVVFGYIIGNLDLFERIFLK